MDHESFIKFISERPPYTDLIICEDKLPEVFNYINKNYNNLSQSIEKLPDGTYKVIWCNT